MRGFTPEHWNRISAYLDEALELPATEREAWLVALEGCEAELAGHVRALLQRHNDNDAGRFLESPLLPQDEGNSGEQVGAYTLETPLGRGGMGAVWRARRSDGRFEGRAAIKLLNRASLGPRAAQQIRHEAGLLAQLSHPNIARLLDAGVRDNGQPFLILEYIEGERLDHYCAQRALALPERLVLFATVLEAVAHAHEHRIVHRDLKPSNILVTADGVVKLLDFGVASLQEPGDIPRQNGMAQGMTLGYAAPEQIRGEAVTAATDVYALGILLYVLVTGSHPLGEEGTRPTQLRHATLEGELTPASAQLHAPGARRWVRGDLDAIIVKATEREPLHRYPSAAEFCTDVRRFLAGEPLQARPRTLAYRSQMYLRRSVGLQPGAGPAQRRRGLVLLATLLVLSVGIAAALWRSAASERARARLEQERAARAAADHRQPFTPPAHSIAVLPLVNESGNAGENYFSEGLTEEITNALSRNRGLKVAARTSAAQFSARPNDVRDIARALGVASILEGGVRRSADQVRISVQLIDAVSGFETWSKSYQRAARDALDIQDEIARAVSSALQAGLPGGPAGMEVGGTRIASAHDAFLQGYYRDTTEIVSLKRAHAALASYARAIELDPGYALPYAWRVHDLYYLGRYADAPQPRFKPLARASAERAVALAPDLGEAHAALAWILKGELDYAGAARENERALALAPGSTYVLTRYADSQTAIGHCDPALMAARRAVELDRLNVNTYRYLANALDCKRQFQDELTVLEQAQSLDAHNFMVRLIKGGVYLALGDARHALPECLAPEPAWSDDKPSCLAIAYWKLGRKTEARDEMSRFIAKRGDIASYFYAYAFAQLDDKENALKWLAAAVRLRNPYLERLRTDWTLDPLRSDPRFKAIEAALHLPD